MSQKLFGPVKSGRSCQDIIWLILLILVWCGMAAVTYFAGTTGNLQRLQYARDTEGNLCGSPVGPDSLIDLTNKTKLYLFNVNSNTSYKVCISECPSKNLETICRYDITASTDEIERLNQINRGDCSLTIASKPVLNRCVPTVLTNLSNKIEESSGDNNTSTVIGKVWNMEFNKVSMAQKIYQDFLATWWIILTCCGVALILSFLWLVVAQWFGGAIVWITILFSLVLTWAVSGYLLYNYYLIFMTGKDSIQSGIDVIDTQLYNEKLLLAVGIVFSVITLILTLVVCCCVGRIKLAIEIIKEASKAMRSMPFIVFFPVFKYMFLLGFIAYFSVVYALLATSGKTISNQVTVFINNSTQEITGKSFENLQYQYLQIYHVFGFLWTYNWIIAISQTTIAGSIATWYWTRDKSHMPLMVVISSFIRTIRYHLGSLALGSLLIALVQLVRYLLSVLQERLKASKSKVAEAIFCCFQCCFLCLEKLLKMLTKNAYIEIAVYGKSFCSACRDVFSLISRNALRLIVIDKVSSFIIFLGKLGVVCGTTIVGVIGLSKWRENDIQVSNWSVPMVLIIVFSYLIATGFMSIFEMAIDTIFVSFCEDCEHNDGSAEKPYFMSESLLKYINKQNEVVDVENRSSSKKKH